MEDLQLYLAIFFALLLSTILIRAALQKARPTACLLPSPPVIPIIGHLHLLGRSPHRALHRLSNQYGPLFQIRLGAIPCVVASSPETAKEFLKTQETSFSNKPQLSVVNYLSYPSSDFTFADFGPYWKFMKKLCVAHLLGGQTLDQLIPVRREEIRHLLNALLERANSNEKVNVGRELTKLSSNIISRMIMSQRCSENYDEDDQIRRVVQESTEVLGKFNLSDYIWFFKSLDLQGIRKKGMEIHEKFDQIMEKIMKQHEEARKGGSGKDDKVKDLLDILLEILEDQIDGAEIRLTREHIKAFVLDVLVAGTDTCSITVEWALSELINHPKMMNKAREEIEAVVGNNRLVQESDIPSLPYLQAIVKETLRLHPPGPLLFREASQNCTVSSYDIPKNTRLFVNVWAINRDPKHWESPLEFDPERFRGGSVDVRGQYFHFLPFGSGKRGCPGTSLGLQVVTTSLAAMIQCFEWKIHEKDRAVDMEEGHGFTLPRARPLICVPVARISPTPVSF